MIVNNELLQQFLIIISQIVKLYLRKNHNFTLKVRIENGMRKEAIANIKKHTYKKKIDNRI